MTHLWMATGSSVLRLGMAWIVFRHGGYRCRKHDRYYIKGAQVTLDKLPLHYGLRYQRKKVAGRMASATALGVIQSLRQKIKDWEKSDDSSSY